MSPTGRSSFLRWGLVLAAGAIGTLLYHLGQFRYAFAFFLTERGDGRFVTYICEHWYQSLAGRAPLLSPRFFYPVEGALGYSDALVGYALPYSLLRALGLDLFSAMQAVVIVFNLLAFLACFLLLHRVLRLHAFASGAAAFFFAFSSPKFAQLGHLQLQFTVLLPLLFVLPILFARDALDRRRGRAFGLLALFVLAFHLQLLNTFYYAWFFSFWSLLFVAVSLLFTSTRRFLVDLFRGSWPVIAGALCLGLAASLPFFAIYWPAMRDTNPYPYEEVASMIPASRDFLDMGAGNRVWGEISFTLRQSPPPPTAGELRIGIGLIPTLAWIGLTLFALGAVAGLVRWSPENDGRQEQRRAHRQSGELFLVAMVLATGVFIALGMKYGNGASPWRQVYDFLPGADAIRAVARYVIFLTLPMAVGFAWAIDRAWRLAAGRRPGIALGAYAAIVLLASFGAFEQLGIHKGFSKAAEHTYLEELAARLPPDCEAFHLGAVRPRASMAEHQYDAMMLSIRTGVPTLNGASGHFPHGWHLGVTDPVVYDANLRDWIARERIPGKVCSLEITMPFEMVEANMWAWTYDPRRFVRRHYLDLLRREPTPEELAKWVETIERCPRADFTCDRIHVSETIFQSLQFLGQGDFLFRLYLAALGRPPTFREFHADMTRLDQLRATTGSEEDCRLGLAIRLAERIEALGRTEGVVRPAVVESADVLLERARAALPRDIENRIRVTLFYFGYLQRDPGPGLPLRLEQFEADGDTRALTAGFLRSSEYRARLDG